MFGKTSRRLTVRQVPVVPACGTNRGGELTVEKRDGGEIAPGAAEVHFDAGFGGHATVVEDESERLEVGRGGGGDVTALEAVDVAICEESGGAAEDEVSRTFDVAVLEVLAAAV